MDCQNNTYVLYPSAYIHSFLWYALCYAYIYIYIYIYIYTIHSRSMFDSHFHPTWSTDLWINWRLFCVIIDHSILLNYVFGTVVFANDPAEFQLGKYILLWRKQRFPNSYCWVIASIQLWPRLCNVLYKQNLWNIVWFTRLHCVHMPFVYWYRYWVIARYLMSHLERIIGSSI